jgi:hypothetical protein
MEHRIPEPNVPIQTKQSTMDHFIGQITHGFFSVSTAFIRNKTNPMTKTMKWNRRMKAGMQE